MIDTHPDRLIFDTSDGPAEEAVDRYRAFYGLGAQVAAIGPDVGARVEAWRLDRILMYHRRLSGLAHERDLDQRDRNGFTHFTATLVLDGELAVEAAGGASFHLRPGDVLLMDVAIPSKNHARDVEMITLSIARDRMMTIAGDPRSLHGSILQAEQSSMFRDFVGWLVTNVDRASAPERVALSETLIKLLALGLDRAGIERKDPLSQRDVERLSQFRRLVDSRLSETGWDPPAAIQESGLSRATLYRLLKPYGGVARFLRDRRLERVRLLLSDTGEVRPLPEIFAATGLPSISSASKGFLDQYSLRPARYRDLVRAGSNDDAFFKLRFWQNELR